ncbi:hypothetical protein [Allokutzneria sp. NRRL B-24872]|uniref:hypothetical protein n=1 Tax=Allokutzneria sp. NRRL B-24872 TaxID=1137961 RepID=UPI000A3793EE|nr:hypothetical protein [Allokutzneria sp. NRRL B-24872]
MPYRRLVLVGAAVLLTSCSTPPGDAESDRQADTLATAISYPRQDSAMNLARAALSVWKGHGGLAVLEAREIPVPDRNPTKTFAHLVIRVHRPAVEPVMFAPRKEELNACYAMDFNYYGIVDKPTRTSCPGTATPITPPPTRGTSIPQGGEDAIRKALAALPPTPTEAQVRDAVAREMPEPRVDSETKLADHVPPVTALVKGEDIGVSMREGASCLIASRKSGKVYVGYLSRVQAMPGELGCSAEVALGR